jgi:beta-glucuronidase
MPRSRLLPLLALVLAAVAPAAARAQADTPSPGALYDDGPSGRYLVDGTWLFRQDPSNKGIADKWERNSSIAGWAPIQVPYTWNFADSSVKSFVGGVAWYRKDFKLPSADSSATWVVRFESVNYRSEVWLNGRELGTHAGAYLPFEFRLPAKALRRNAVNHLVVRTDNRRTAADLPPGGLQVKTNMPVGGWWNYGGILREVYLRRVNHVDISSLQILPTLPCRTCPASVLLKAVVQNVGRRGAVVHLSGTYGTHAADLGRLTVPGGGSTTFTTRLKIVSPQLWSPDHPNLYHVVLNATIGSSIAQTWTTDAGIKQVKVQAGHLYLNGLPLNVRGFGLHEDSADKGFAIDDATRDKIIAAAKEGGATMIRAHYPLHPYTLEQADRKGLLVWSEIPMYQVKNGELNDPAVRAKGLSMLTTSILTNSSHPSIALWSIGNELNGSANHGQADYIRAAARTEHRLDPTRPVGLAYSGNPHGTCQSAYKPLDVLGVNEYFDWYPGPDGSAADPSLLSDFLDSVHKCYPTKALLVTETGAEANRDGPPEERGTYAFQQNYAQYQFGVISTKPWISGALWWALQEFRVRPDWDGGDPRPDPPLHQKGLITLDWVKKPAFATVQSIFNSTDQLGTGSANSRRR